MAAWPKLDGVACLGFLSSPLIYLFLTVESLLSWNERVNFYVKVQILSLYFKGVLGLGGGGGGGGGGGEKSYII